MQVEVLDKPTKLRVVPISYSDACEFIRQYHRHHKPPAGWKFGLAVAQGEKIVGIAMVGRPVSRHLDNGWTLEVNRSCTDGTPHVASKLYAACWRAARAMGYRRLITYTLEQEPGTSLIAAGWTTLYKTRGGSWNCSGRPRVDKAPTGPKRLWEVRNSETKPPKEKDQCK